jgi:OmpA family
VAENPLVVDTLTRNVHEMRTLDLNGDGFADGLGTLIYWTFYDLPYPAPPFSSADNFAGFDPLGPREREELGRLGVIAERAEVEVVRIRGHASGEGGAPGNQLLSDLRANAVAAAITALHTDAPNRNIRVAADAEIIGLGETEPEVFTEVDREKDHPLNRRVEIAFTITRIAGAVPAPNAGRKWKIGFDQALSFYRIAGGQVGLGTLTRLDDAEESVQQQGFWYLATGVGYELGGRISGTAATVRDKLARGGQLNPAERAVLALDAKRTALLNRLDALVPPGARPLLDKLKAHWQNVTDTLDQLGADVADKTREQQAVEILGAMGVSSLTSRAALDGYFETSISRTMSELEDSVLLLFQLSISSPALGLAGTLEITAIAMYIPDPDPANVGEWITTVIAEGAVDAEFVPTTGETAVSANISSIFFR